MSKKKEYMTALELIEYLPEKPTIFTIYQWTKKKLIPFKRFGGKLFFEKQLIDKWNDDNRPAQII